MVWQQPARCRAIPGLAILAAQLAFFFRLADEDAGPDRPGAGVNTAGPSLRSRQFEILGRIAIGALRFACLDGADEQKGAKRRGFI
jgi:hypothetical protein